MDTIKEIKEQVAKYTEATDVDFEKMAGQGGVKFYEFKVDENGDMKTITHIALPILSKDQRKFFELFSDLQELSAQTTNKTNKLTNQLNKIIETASNLTGTEEEKEAEIKKLEAKTEALTKEIKILSMKNADKLNSIRYEMAYLVFKRTEKTSPEKIAEWIQQDALSEIPTVAMRISNPPKQ